MRGNRPKEHSEKASWKLLSSLYANYHLLKKPCHFKVISLKANWKGNPKDLLKDKTKACWLLSSSWLFCTVQKWICIWQAPLDAWEKRVWSVAIKVDWLLKCLFFLEHYLCPSGQNKGSQIRVFGKPKHFRTFSWFSWKGAVTIKLWTLQVWLSQWKLRILCTFSHLRSLDGASIWDTPIKGIRCR